VIARTVEGGVVCDGLWEEPFRKALMNKFIEATGGEDASQAAPGWSVEVGPQFDPVAARANLDHSQVLQSEQSNSSVAYGTRYFLKLYRKWECGPHPEVRVLRHLSEVQDFDAVARYGGALRVEGRAGMGVVGLLVDYTVHQGDGWQHALDSLARFFERVSTAESASAVAFNDLVGGVYPDRVRQLGERTGELHWALSRNLDEPEFAPESFTGHAQRALYQSMRSALGRALRSLRRALPGLSDPLRAVADRILASERELLAHQARLLETPLKAGRILIHGDYHLGQVLNTGKDFMIIDFEGEPRRSIGERGLKRPALQDVAGMVRSFDYAAHVALGREQAEDQPKLESWAEAWSRSMAELFVAAYREKTRGGVFVPESLREFDLLLDTLVLDKAFYELDYELAYRPDFVGLPLRAIDRFLQRKIVGAG
jgi:maltose alpha-D-glucosyltransferase/alpha-amylase